VGLSSRSAPLSQQLQAMLMLQQENHKRFSTQQPARHMVPTGRAAVGWRVGLFRPEVGVYYYGMVMSFDLAQHMVEFDDGVVEVVTLSKQRIDWVSEKGAEISTAAQALHKAYLQSRGELPLSPPPAAAVTHGPGGDAAPPASHPVIEQPRQTGPLPDAPKQVDVICGPNQAVFDCVRMAVMTQEGMLISPTEFERQSGKGCSKKWKATIRVRKANGFPGMTMGDWLLQMGYEQPRPVPTPGEGGRSNSLNEIRRRTFSRRAMALGASPPAASGVSGDAREGFVPPSCAPACGGGAQNRGTTSHRPNCMCVICKQARRKAAQAKGLPYTEDGQRVELLGPAAAAKAATEASKAFKVPDWLIGKRAFVQAVPHLVRGAMQHQLWEVPESRSYTPAEWEAAQAAEEDPSAAAAAAAAGGGSRPGTPGLSVGPDSRASTPGPADAPAAAAGAADSAGGDVIMTDAAAAGEGEGDQQQQQGAAGAAGAAGQQQQLVVKGGRSTTWRSKLRVCQALEPKRITFGKSGIHGWGIFARRAIPADTMVTEFRGQLIRGILADVREAGYRKQVGGLGQTYVCVLSSWARRTLFVCEVDTYVLRHLVQDNCLGASHAAAVSNSAHQQLCAVAYRC
jgi:hypothetical protein